MITLAQTYIHFNTDASQEDLDVARRYFMYVSALAASKHFNTDVLIDLRVEEGSLKGWITVAGVIYTGICNYGSLREGIDHLVKDGKEFSEFVINRTLIDLMPPAGSLVRSERRLGVPGQIARLLPLINKAVDEFHSGDSVDGKEYLKQIRSQLDRIESEFINAGELDALEQLRECIPGILAARLPGPTPMAPSQTIHASPVLLDRRREQEGLSPKQILTMFSEPPTPPKIS